MSVRTGAAGLLCLAAAAAWTSCIYDKDDRCSPGEELNAAGYCECPAGSVPVYNEVFVTDGKPDGNLMRLSCRPCGAHEVVTDDKCVCDAGFTRESETAPCVAETAPRVNYGVACSDDSACTGPGATCILDDSIGFTATEARAGYCSTRDCSTHADCPASQGYGCYPGDPVDGGAARPFCRKKLEGEGDSCDGSMNDADNLNPACSKEAAICFPLASTCIPREVCLGDDRYCAPGLICCDLTGFSGNPDAYLCMASDTCPTD
jgi:hypothetical protein